MKRTLKQIVSVVIFAVASLVAYAAENTAVNSQITDVKVNASAPPQKSTPELGHYIGPNPLPYPRPTSVSGAETKSVNSAPVAQH